MKIGFSYMWPLGSYKKERKQFIGDELYGRSLRTELLKLSGIEYCELFNDKPEEPLDIMVYWNDTLPNPTFAKKSVLYFQNAWKQGAEVKLREFQKRNYDGYMFMSSKLLNYHQSLGGRGIYLSSAANIELMQPKVPDEKYDWDVTYVGNDIKGKERTEKFIYPATKFKFGLYGNWNTKFWFLYKYRRVFHNISKGKLPLAETPMLYSSSKIVLNCTAADHVKWDVVTGRIYDVLACNGFLITDFYPEREKELARCMVVTKGGVDLEDKIRYYLNHPEEREKVSCKGRETILNGHTMADRAKTMLEYFKSVLN